MRFVEIKTCEQQSPGPSPHAASVHAPASAVSMRSGANGRVRPGRSGGPQWPSAIDRFWATGDERVPEWPVPHSHRSSAQLGWLNEQVLEIDRLIRAGPVQRDGQPADEVPGVGPVLASAMVASGADPKVPIRQKLLGLDRACAAAELQRRQGEAGRHHQAG